MIQGGWPTLVVADMDRAVAFYTEVLGLAVSERHGNDWCEIDAGSGMKIGLHPAGEGMSAPGTAGSITLGLRLVEPIENVVAKLQERGVTFFGPIVDSPPTKLAFFADPDGNALYLCEYAHATAGTH